MFKNPFSFRGRIRRLEYGLSMLLFLVPYTLIMLNTEWGESTDQLVGFMIYIPLLWFIFAQGAKRCHDRGVNGWWQFWPSYWIVLFFYKGEIGPNDYGEDPKGVYYEFNNKSKEPEVIASNKEAPFHMENLSQLLDSKDINGSIIEIDDFINSCHYGDNLEGLSIPQQKFLFNQNLERQMNNGGFWQFFMNSSGDYAHETVHSLQEIEAIKTADIVQTAIDLFPGSTVPKEWSERQKLVEKIDPDKMIWEELDQRFMSYEEDLNDLNIKFVAKHKSSF